MEFVTTLGHQAIGQERLNAQIVKVMDVSLVGVLVGLRVMHARVAEWCKKFLYIYMAGESVYANNEEFTCSESRTGDHDWRLSRIVLGGIWQQCRHCKDVRYRGI